MDGAAREERPPAVWVPPPGNAQTEGGKRGEGKTGGVFSLNMPLAYRVLTQI